MNVLDLEKSSIKNEEQLMEVWGKYIAPNPEICKLLIGDIELLETNALWQKTSEQEKIEHLNKRLELYPSEISSILDALKNFEVNSGEGLLVVQKAKEVVLYFRNKYIEKLNPSMNELEPENQIKALTNKQEILLLYHLGIFGIEKIKEMPIGKKAKLFSILLNRNERNTQDYMNNIGSNKKELNCKTPQNIKKVNEILKELGLEQIKK